MNARHFAATILALVAFAATSPVNAQPIVDTDGEHRPLSEANELFSSSPSAVTVEILRRGNRHSVDLTLVENTTLLRASSIGVATLIAASLMILPLLLLMHSRSRAALPLAIFYSSAGVIAITALSGQPSTLLNIAAIFALAIAPAAIVQIGMVIQGELLPVLV